jgi:hypothetical protein
MAGPSRSGLRYSTTACSIAAMRALSASMFPSLSAGAVKYHMASGSYTVHETKERSTLMATRRWSRYTVSWLSWTTVKRYTPSYTLTKSVPYGREFIALMPVRRAAASSDS